MSRLTEGDIGPQVEAALRELPPFQIRISRDDGAWVARGVEYDIAAQADTFEAVMANFAWAFIGQALVNMHHGKAPMEDVPPTPDRTAHPFDDCVVCEACSARVLGTEAVATADECWLCPKCAADVRASEVGHG